MHYHGIIACFHKQFVRARPTCNVNAIRVSCSLDIEACSRLMHQMGEARLQASKAILSYVVPSASDLIDQVELVRI